VSSLSTVASNRSCSYRNPQNARTSGMLLMTSTISPSTAAALWRNRRATACPRRPGGNIATTHAPAMTISPGRHRRLTVPNQGNRRDRRHARRQHVPDEHVLYRVDCVRRRGNAAGQHARQPVGKIARRVAGQMTEDVAAQDRRLLHECEARDPTRDPPKEIIRRDQRHEENECQPYAAGVGSSRRQSVDPGPSRRIACLPNTQPPQQPTAG